MKRVIFPILGFDPSDKRCDGEFDSGTGFLINNEGYFFTAGHNFYRKERGSDELIELTCFAYIDNQLIEIERLYIEYVKDFEGRKKDFAYGKLKIPSYKINPNVIIDSEDCLMIGYSIRDLPFEIIETVQFKDTNFNLYKVPITPTSNIFEYHSIKIFYDNVLFFDCTKNMDFFGLSGCPVIKKNILCGVLVSNCFITMDYLETIVNIDGKIKVD